MTSPVTPEAVASWQAHVSRVEERHEVLSAEALRRFAAATGADLDVERTPPPLGHWAFFLEARAADGLGDDGHPLRGGLMPPVPLPRRMFAGGAMRFPAPLVVGAPAMLRLTVADVRYVPGRSGDLVFVEVDRVLVQDGTERVSERQTIVYRAQGGSMPPVQPAGPPVAGEVWTPGPVDLFRFSAATFNAHRIHYDAAYASVQEGYPGTVVHGPFTAAKLCALAGRARRIRSFAFRAATPFFAGQPIVLTHAEEPGSVHAIRCDGVVGMTARATLFREQDDERQTV